MGFGSILKAVLRGLEATPSDAQPNGASQNVSKLGAQCSADGAQQCQCGTSGATPGGRTQVLVMVPNHSPQTQAQFYVQDSNFLEVTENLVTIAIPVISGLSLPLNEEQDSEALKISQVNFLLFSITKNIKTQLSIFPPGGKIFRLKTYTKLCMCMLGSNPGPYVLHHAMHVLSTCEG